MYEIVTDLIPYPDLEGCKMNDLLFRVKVVNDEYRPQFREPINESLRVMIERCWSKDPSERPSFRELFDSLSKDCFLDEVDIDELNLYIDDITRINDPTEELIRKVEDLERENEQIKKLKAENK